MILLGFIYVLELLKYWLSANICFGFKLRKVCIGAIGLLAYLAIVQKGNLNQYASIILLLFIVIIILMITVEAKLGQKIIKILMLLFVISGFDELINVFISFLFNHQEVTTNSYYLSYFFVSIITFLLIVLLFILKRKKFVIISSEKLKHVTNINIYMLIIIMGISLLMTIAGLNYTKRFVNNDKVLLSCNIIITVAFTSVILLGCFITYIINANEKIEKLLETERLLHEMQINYDKLMLEKEEDTSRFRHDINNHLICLRRLLEENQTISSMKYIDMMQEKILVIQRKGYSVGNEIIDAMLNYHLGIIENTVKVSVLGKCIGEIDVNNMDLCTIISNLIQNAVEELNRIDMKEQYLKIKVHSGKENVQIEMINSTYCFCHPKMT